MNQNSSGLIWGLILVLPLLFNASGCATHADRAVVVRNSYRQGNLEAALLETSPEKNKGKHDADVMKLNRALLHLAQGDSKTSEKLLREVRDRFDHLQQTSVAEKAASMMTDDRQLAYHGEEYEKILIRVMLGISNLMNGGDDVHAYALQVSNKQQELLQKQQAKEPGAPSATSSSPELTNITRQLAIGSYLRAAVLESSLFDYDDVQRCRVQVANWQPDFRDAQIDLARAESGIHSAPGHGVVYLFAMVGEGPYKEEEVAPVTTLSLLAADRVLSAVGKYELPPNIAPVRIPMVVRSPQQLKSIEVSQQGKPLGNTATIMNVSELAIEQCKEQKDEVIGRAVARRIVKKGTVYAVKDGFNVRSPEVDLLLTVAGVVWELAERADTRCWSLLPDRIQVVRLELPAGTQELTLTPQRQHAGIGPASTISVNVQSGRSTFVVGHFPQDRVVGEIQVSAPR